VVNGGLLRLALYQPDIPQNAGALLRLGACLAVPIDIIEPCGFLFTDRHMRRAGMDYLDQATWVRHESWDRFLDAMPQRRLILLTARAELSYTDFAFQADDVLVVGRESAGAPPEVHDKAHARVKIPLQASMRSINVAQAAAMVLGEALRQTKGFPGR
jgi:tRNA (cytidine/uridine-2'-O-)-methyltransferase